MGERSSLRNKSATNIERAKAGSETVLPFLPFKICIVNPQFSNIAQID
jgi:hypothetical protein